MAYGIRSIRTAMLATATERVSIDRSERWERDRVVPSDLHTITMIASSYTPDALSYLPQPVVNLALPAGGATGSRRER
jgi:hypothetical protein